MTHNRKRLLGSVIAGAFALVCGIGAARAQDYSYYGNGASYDDRGETVVVRPPGEFDTPHSRTLTGHIDGQVNPTVRTMSHPVSFADLDLNRRSDFNELRARIRDTAIDMCAALNDGYPDIVDTTEARECVRDAVHNAMAQIPERPVG